MDPNDLDGSDQAVTGTSAEAAATPSPEPSTTQDVKPADPSPAADVKPASLLDAVKDVLKPPSAPSADEVQDPTKPPQPDSQDGKPPEGDKKPVGDVPQEFAKHPAWQRIMKERDGFKPDALQYRSITRFMSDNNLSAAQVSDAIKLLAMVRSDPTKALESLKGTVGELEVLLGKTLPKDLQDQVDSGALTEEAAKEISELRANKNIRETREANQRKANETAETERKGRETFDGVTKAVDGWEKAAAKTDTDFARKRPMIVSEMRSIVVQRGSLLATPEDARAVAEQAYKTVNAWFRSQAVPPKPIRGALVDNGSLAGSSPAEPKTSREAVLAGIAKTRAG